MNNQSAQHAHDSGSWGSWDDAEQSAHAAFKQRSPEDRLAWLDDILRLRASVAIGDEETAHEQG